MKKKILCIFLCLFITCSCVFVSCSNDKTPEEIMREITEGSITARTISIWIPTESDTSSQAFSSRLAAVEKEINNTLRKSNEGTQIKIVAVNDSEYEAKLQERFEYVESLIGSGRQSAFASGQSYKNTAVLNENGLYELAYPDVLDTQIDICLIRDYDSYSSYVSLGRLRELDSYISTSSNGKYAAISNMIQGKILSQMKMPTPDGSATKTYAIPNNHDYEGEYTYLLINKSVADAIQGFAHSVDETGNYVTNGTDVLSYNENAITDIFTCKDLINAIGEAQIENVIPFVASENDIPGIVWWGNDGNTSLVSSIPTEENGANPQFLLNNETYVNYVKLCKELEANGYISDVAEAKTSAVSFFKGTEKEAEQYANDYYMLKSASPVIGKDQIYSSMFSVTSYSVDYDRAMRILYLLDSNVTLQTLLQYGIEGEDYEIEYPEEEGASPVLNLTKDGDGNVIYNMNNKYTGNAYITYYGDGYTTSDAEWAKIKVSNYQTVVSPYIKSDYYKSQKLESGLIEYGNTLFGNIESMNSDEFNTFIDDWKNANKENTLVASILDSTEYADIQTYISNGINAIK